MRRKRLLVLAGVVLVAFGAASATQRYRWSQRVARSRFLGPELCERIKPGMSQAEVEAVLGGPPGDFTTNPTGLLFSAPPLVPHAPPCKWDRWQGWYGDRGGVMVYFTDRGTVEEARPGWADPLVPVAPSPAERVRGWFRSLWP
jgi:hypothetical protein